MDNKIFSLFLFSFLLIFTGCNSSRSDSKGGNEQFQKSGVGESESIVSSTQEFSDEDKESLVFMWEEEKLARDVYNYMYAKYNKKIFSNIASSEQKHMDSVKNMLTQARLTLPSSETISGVFKDPELQNLYDQLVLQGNESWLQAVNVGIAIETKDISDLQERTSRTQNGALITLYEKLLEASYKHLSSFQRQL